MDGAEIKLDVLICVFNKTQRIHGVGPLSVLGMAAGFNYQGGS